MKRYSKYPKNALYINPKIALSDDIHHIDTCSYRTKIIKCKNAIKNVLKVAYSDILFEDYETICKAEIYLNLNIIFNEINIDELCKKYNNLSWFCLNKQYSYDI